MLLYWLYYNRVCAQIVLYQLIHSRHSRTPRPTLSTMMTVNAFPINIKDSSINTNKREFDDALNNELDSMPLKKRQDLKPYFDKLAVAAAAAFIDYAQTKEKLADAIQERDASTKALQESEQEFARKAAIIGEQDAALAQKYHEVEQLQERLENQANDLESLDELRADNQRLQELANQAEENARQLNTEIQELQTAVNENAATRMPTCMCCEASLISCPDFVTCSDDACSTFLCKTCVEGQVESVLGNAVSADGIACLDPACKCVIDSHIKFSKCIPDELYCKYIEKKCEAKILKENEASAQNEANRRVVMMPCGCGPMPMNFDACACVQCPHCKHFMCGLTFQMIKKGEFDPEESDRQIWTRAHDFVAQEAGRMGFTRNYFIPAKFVPAVERIWMRYFLEKSVGRPNILEVCPKFDSCNRATLHKLIVIAGLPDVPYGPAPWR